MNRLATSNGPQPTLNVRNSNLLSFWHFESKVRKPMVCAYFRSSRKFFVCSAFAGSKNATVKLKSLILHLPHRPVSPVSVSCSRPYPQGQKRRTPLVFGGRAYTTTQNDRTTPVFLVVFWVPVPRLPASCRSGTPSWSRQLDGVQCAPYLVRDSETLSVADQSAAVERARRTRRPIQARQMRRLS